MRTPGQYWLVLIVPFLLVGCFDSKKEEVPVAPTPPPKPILICATYSIANIAYRITGNGQDVKVVFPVPADVDPMYWLPDSKVIGAIRGQVLNAPGDVVFFVPETRNPGWVEELSKDTNAKIVTLGGVANTPVGYHPLRAGELATMVADRLKTLAPDSSDSITRRTEALQRELDSLAERWREVAGKINREVKIYGVGEALPSWNTELDAAIEVADDWPGLLAKIDDTKPASVILGADPPREVVVKLQDDNIDSIKLKDGMTRPGQGDLLTVLRSNLDSLSPLESLKPPEEITGYEGLVVPVLERYCIDCHDTDNEEGEVNFDLFQVAAEAERNPDLWETVAAVIDMKQMPPRKKTKQPSDEERQHLIDWSKELTGRWESGEMGWDPGRTTIRRLNKNEYNYTVRDLFGFKIRPGDQFPEDSGGEAGFDNNADALFLPSLLMENYVEAAGIIVQSIYANYAAKNKYLMAKPGGGATPRQAARKVLKYWAQRAYRRPVLDSEVDSLVKIFDNETAKKKNYEQAMKMPLVSILISPNFLYRSEVEKKNTNAYPVDDFDLASRLSYFLWSSMPDYRLFGLAGSGKLRDPNVLRAEVKRMLEDEKAAALSMHFAGQWFGWEKLRTSANPDQKKYPTFTFQLRVALYRESTEYFKHIIGSNASAYQLIDSDYAFLNQQLAYHYRIPGVTGPDIRMVKLKDRNRGGVLGMGSVLTATSLPLRSSPAIRGNYVLSEILGTAPPDPPMDVAQLPDDDREVKAQTFREALVQHREDPNCKACHEAIDPIGFGLENFDAIGRWRTKQNGIPLETSGEMPDGTKFSSVPELKQRLLNDKELFARVLVTKLLSYALGRELTPYDRPVIRRITDKVIADDARIHTAFIEVALSYPFRYRRNDVYKPSLSLPSAMAGTQ